MIIIASFTKKLFKRAKLLFDTLKKFAGEAKVVVYYENVGNEVFTQEIFDEYKEFEWRNIAKDRNLRKIHNLPEWRLARRIRNVSTKYHCVHARYWFRKIVAIRTCVLTHPQEKLFVWLDADCIAYKNLLDPFTISSQRGDIGHIARADEGRPTDTGIIIFNTERPITIDFIFGRRGNP